MPCLSEDFISLQHNELANRSGLMQALGMEFA
jgi:hypothetical protein